MKNKARYIPFSGALVEVVSRTLQARFLLRPGRELNAIIVGILAKAQQLVPIQIIGFVCMSNHYHALLWVPNVQQLSRFMNFLNSNLALEAGRLHDWRSRFWARRYHHTIVSEEEEAQVRRLKYLLAHGAKEGLVARGQDWPGVHPGWALLHGQPLQGVWFDRTAEYDARQRGREIGDSFAHPLQLHLDRLPCWQHLSDEEYREAIAGLLQEVEEEAYAMRKAEGIELPSRRSLLEVDPHSRPDEPKATPAPLFHAVSREVKEEMKRAFSTFLEAYREASDKLRRGNREAVFPGGCFPPGLPYQPHAPPTGS